MNLQITFPKHILYSPLVHCIWVPKVATGKPVWIQPVQLMNYLSWLINATSHRKAIGASHYLPCIRVGFDQHLISALGQSPQKPSPADGEFGKVTLVTIEHCAGSISCRIQFMYDGYPEAVAKFFPDVWSHAIPPGHLDIVLLVQLRMGGVEKVSAQLTNVLDDVCPALAHFGPEGAVRKFMGENYSTACMY